MNNIIDSLTSQIPASGASNQDAGNQGIQPNVAWIDQNMAPILEAESE